MTVIFYKSYIFTLVYFFFFNADVDFELLEDYTDAQYKMDLIK